MKICSKCGLSKENSEFPKKGAWCKICVAFYQKEYKKLHENELKDYFKEYYEDNKEEIIKATKDYYENNKEEILEAKKEYKKKNKRKLMKARNELQKLKRKIDPMFAIRVDVSSSISKQLKTLGSSKNNESCIKYLEYSIQELKEHLEKQFEPWMTWENRGKYDPDTWDDNDPTTWTWQIDHIIPHSEFKYLSMKDEEFRLCWALSNLRPLSAKQNFLDGRTKTRHKLIK